eukprot:3100899-Pyramimonas_sp.AAC.1
MKGSFLLLFPSKEHIEFVFHSLCNEFVLPSPVSFHASHHGRYGRDVREASLLQLALSHLLMLPPPAVPAQSSCVVSEASTPGTFNSSCTEGIGTNILGT